MPLGVQPVPAGNHFTMVVPAVAPGQVVTATATIDASSRPARSSTDGGPGPTIQSITPGSGAPSGGTAFTLHGLGVPRRTRR